MGNYLYVYIGIIQYNVFFRDYLHTNGPDALIELLCEMAPAFRNETEAISSLKEKMQGWGPLGNYDILNGIHIACNLEPYPTFDSFDSADDREYCNYFFLSRRFNRSDLKMIDSMKTYGNNNKVSEHMKCIVEMPVLYYEGDGSSILLVTPRQS